MLLNNLDRRGRRAAGGARRLRRLREGGPQPRGAAGDRAHAARARRRRDAARPERQAGRRLPHAPRRAARADRELAARAALGDLGRVPPARGARADDVRPDDRRVAGSTSARRGSCRARTRRSRAAGEKHFGSPDLRGRTILTAGLGGMGGAQPLAATLAGAAILCVEVDPSPDRAPARDAVPRRGDRLARRRARAACARRSARAAPLSVGLLGNAADVVPELARARRALRPRHRPDRRARPADRLRAAAGSTSRRPPRCAPSDPDEYLRRARASIVAHVEGMLEYVRRRRYVFDYGNNLRGEALEGGRSGGVHIPGLRPGLYPAALLPRHRAVPLGGALGRPRRHRGDRRGAPRALPGRRAPAALARAGARAGRVPGAARADLLARLRRPCQGGARDQRARPHRARSRRRS